MRWWEEKRGRNGQTVALPQGSVLVFDDSTVSYLVHFVQGIGSVGQGCVLPGAEIGKIADELGTCLGEDGTKPSVQWEVTMGKSG